MNSLLSFSCFVAGWSLCLLFASPKNSLILHSLEGDRSTFYSTLADMLPMLGPAIVAVLFVIQSFWMTDAARTIRLSVIVALIGTLIDTAFIRLGVYWVAEQMGVNWMCPLWITAMWIALGVSLHGWLAVFSRRLLLAVPLGAVGCLAVYVSADWLGAIGVDLPMKLALPLFVVFGALTLPALLWLSNSPSYRLRELESEAGGRAAEDEI